LLTKERFEQMKASAFKPLSLAPETVIEKQMETLRKKHRRMSETEIGRRLGVREDSRLEDLPITDYDFYKPYFESPSPSAFMYPLDQYFRVKTSGTRGAEKWFLLAKAEYNQLVRETFPLLLMATFHDGEKVTFEYGDTMFVNIGPKPFAGAFLLSPVQQSGLINFVPDPNLSFHEKIQYLIHNHEKIDAVSMLASSMVSQVMPEVEGNIRLKGSFYFDSEVAEAYIDELGEFTGSTPKSSYSSTETGIASIPSIQHPLRFIFDWRRGIFEFLPPNRGKEDAPIGLDEVEVGENYRAIFTSFHGDFTRYMLSDGFQCVAKGDDIIGSDLPVFRFGGRLDKTIGLHNFTRIDERELRDVFSDIELKLIDFTARKEVKDGLEHLNIYIEYEGRRSPEKIRDAIHRKLYEIDRDYRDLVDFFNYKPLTVKRLKKGSFTKYLGIKGGTVPKVDHINMSKDELRKLIN